jgi:hypothetical protein
MRRIRMGKMTAMAISMTIKKYTAALLPLCAMICAFALIAGCGKNQDAPAAQENRPQRAKAEGVDVDLTALSGTMVFAEVYNMMSEPDKYVGKKIKAGGIYQTSCFDENNVCYHFVVVADAAGCCPTGLPFVRSGGGERVNPNDYPEEMAMIEVVGIFEGYEGGGRTYYRLAAEDVKVLGR